MWMLRFANDGEPVRFQLRLQRNRKIRNKVLLTLKRLKLIIILLYQKG